MSDDYLLDGAYKTTSQSERRWEKDGRLIHCEVIKPNGKKCDVTMMDKKGNGIVVRYSDDGVYSREIYIGGYMEYFISEGVMTKVSDGGVGSPVTPVKILGEKRGWFS